MTTVERALWLAFEALLEFVGPAIVRQRVVETEVARVSAGHAATGTLETPLSVYTRADDALLEAKRSGKDRVRVAAG